MADVANTLASLNGITKIIYGELVNAIPKRSFFKKRLPLKAEKKIGNSWVELIVTSNEGGVTYGGNSGAMYDLEDAIAMGTQPASITSNEYTLKPQISYGAAQRAAENGKRAFAKSVALVLANSMDSMNRVHETSYIYGRAAKGIGQMAQSALVADTAETKIAVFSDAEWAPYVWAGCENRKLQAYDSGGVLIESGGVSKITLTTVYPGTRRLLLTMTSGLATALAAASAAGVVTFFWYGSKTNDMYGIDYMFSNVSEELFGIDAGDYSQWQGNNFPVSSGPLTFSKVQGFAGQLTNRGLDDEDLILLCNPLTWVDLANEQASLRLYDDSFRQEMAKQGFNALRYMSQNGWIQIFSSGYVKGGTAYMFPLSCLKRIGSSDAEMNLPGQEAEFWTNVPGKNGCESRIYSDHAIFCSKPHATAKISGFTNTFGTAGTPA